MKVIPIFFPFIDIDDIRESEPASVTLISLRLLSRSLSCSN